MNATSELLHLSYAQILNQISCQITESYNEFFVSDYTKNVMQSIFV